MSRRWKAELFIRRRGRAMTAEMNSGVAYSMVCWKLCRAVGQVRPRLAQYIQGKRLDLVEAE